MKTRSAIAWWMPPIPPVPLASSSALEPRQRAHSSGLALLHEPEYTGPPRTYRTGGPISHWPPAADLIAPRHLLRRIGACDAPPRSLRTCPGRAGGRGRRRTAGDRHRRRAVGGDDGYVGGALRDGAGRRREDARRPRSPPRRPGAALASAARVLHGACRGARRHGERAVGRPPYARADPAARALPAAVHAARAARRAAAGAARGRGAARRLQLRRALARRPHDVPDRIHLAPRSHALRGARVRLGRSRLLPAPVVDPREPDERMRGMPITRATTADGRWEYTLYDGTGSYPFVHALDTVRAEALVHRPRRAHRPHPALRAAPAAGARRAAGDGRQAAGRADRPRDAHRQRARNCATCPLRGRRPGAADRASPRPPRRCCLAARRLSPGGQSPWEPRADR